jgi:periplasmic protein TonB
MSYRTEGPEAHRRAPRAASYTIFDTANDRLKRSFGSWFWGSMIAATDGAFRHHGLLAERSTAADVAFTMEEMEAIDLPPEIEIPPPPEQIARPANPVVTDAQIDDDITIAPTTFEDNPIDDLPPPPTEGTVDISDQPTFTPYEVAPEVRNRAHVQQVLQREYPSTLRDAGVGGTVIMHFFINDQGIVDNVLVAESSGYERLDEAALRVAQEFEFTPAMNRDQQVPVWIQIPITFQTR